ncbi:MAG: RNA polymerase sigma factor, partial [Planctomycetota bacterium]
MNPRSAQDTSLLARVAEGDPSAVRDVLSRYSALVWSLSSSLSKDPHEVEDVVQDIFVDVWRSAARYDPAVASEATFIATIARRRVIDRRRRAGRRVDPEPLEEEFAPGAEDEGLRQVELDDEALQAREAVAQLSGDRRRVLEMSVVEGLTHREIAADTGIPLGTVKSHIRRGLAEVSETVARELHEMKTNLHDLESALARDRERLRAESAARIKATRLALMRLTDEELENTTRRV